MLVAAYSVGSREGGGVRRRLFLANTLKSPLNWLKFSKKDRVNNASERAQRAVNLVLKWL